VLQIEFEREDDGRWIAEIPILPGVLAYGATRDEAIARVQALALRVIAERLEHAAQVRHLGSRLDAQPQDRCPLLRALPMAAT